LHAQQRISVFNFFIVLSGILATGIGAGFQAGKTMTPVVAILGALLALFSFVFYRLDGRGSELVKLAEAALILGENTCMPEFARIIAEEGKSRAPAASSPKTWTFGRSFRLIFWVMGIAGGVASIFSLYRFIQLHGSALTASGTLRLAQPLDRVPLDGGGRNAAIGRRRPPRHRCPLRARRPSLEARPAFPPTCDVRGRDPQQQLHVAPDLSSQLERQDSAADGACIKSKRAYTSYTDFRGTHETNRCICPGQH